MSVMTFTLAKSEPVEIQTDRVFYHATGGFRHTWDAWEVVQDPVDPHVLVHWGNRTVALRGSDAYNFLTILKSKHAHLFRR